MIENAVIFEDLDPPKRLLMGPGPVNIYPSVLSAMSKPILGQFDPKFTEYMDQVMVLYRQVFRTRNNWTFLIDGTARAGIEACLVSLIKPGDKVLVPRFGRFGFLLSEISQRCGANVVALDAKWGTKFEVDQIADAVKLHEPKIVALVHGDTSTTIIQPLNEIGPLCRDAGAIVYVDATATLGGNHLEVDTWQLDAVTSGLQKCMSGPPGIAPTTFNDRVARFVDKRKHIEAGIRPDNFQNSSEPIIKSNYFDLSMLMDYWSPVRLNHHTEATSMLYAARECARVVLSEGIEKGIERHRLASEAIRAGLKSMGLELFGDVKYRMHNVTGVCIPETIDGDFVRSEMLNSYGIEIGTAFGPLNGKIWRIGTMGYVCTKQNILRCLVALGEVLCRQGYSVPINDGIDAAKKVFNTNP